MCHDSDARPPVPAGPASPADSAPRTLTAADGTRFAAYEATPATPSGLGVLVLPDNRGLRGFYQHLAVRLAEQGHRAVAIDYFGRTDGVNRDRGDDFPVMPHLLGLTSAGLDDDISAGTELLLTGPAGCRSVVTLGFCLGGRFAFLRSAPRFGFAGAIGFYGAPGPVNGRPGPTQRAAELSGPILGLFGGADDGIPGSDVDAFDGALTAAGVPHELISYPGAPHSFFDVDHAEHAQACADAWRRVLEFLAARAAETQPSSR